MIPELPDNPYTQRPGMVYGEPVGTQEGLTVQEPEELLRLLSWLNGLMLFLEENDLQHHDIHPANILRDEDTFKLIDWEWCNKKELPIGMNLYYSYVDRRAVELLARQIIFTLISRLGHTYKDGSSAYPGWVYHPIPFEPFIRIPAHSYACYSEFDAITPLLPESGTVTDIGCAIGNFSFKMADLGFQVIGLERDEDALNVCKALQIWSGLPARFCGEEPDESPWGRVRG